MIAIYNVNNRNIIVFVYFRRFPIGFSNNK
jgi:hypothetical protein